MYASLLERASISWKIWSRIQTARSRVTSGEQIEDSSSFPVPVPQLLPGLRIDHWTHITVYLHYLEQTHDEAFWTYLRHGSKLKHDVRLPLLVLTSSISATFSGKGSLLSGPCASLGFAPHVCRTRFLCKDHNNNPEEITATLQCTTPYSRKARPPARFGGHVGDGRARLSRSSQSQQRPIYFQFSSHPRNWKTDLQRKCCLLSKQSV